MQFFFSEKIDKKKLFKIARKNALSLVKQGVLPVGSVKKDTLVANLPTKTVDELTGNIQSNIVIKSKLCSIIFTLKKYIFITLIFLPLKKKCYGFINILT